MKLSALIQPLIDAKAPHEQIMAVVMAFEAQQVDALEQRRKSDAERQARKREREAASRDVTLRHSDRSLTGAGDARVEDKTSNTVTEPQVKLESKSPAKPSPRQRLEAVVDAERAEALLDHRQRLRKPLTEHAAKMLATELAKFPDPNAAADRMIAKGWVSTDVTWPEAHSSQARAGPAKAKGTGIGGVFDQLDGYFDGQGNGGGDDKAPQGVVLSLPHRAA